MKNNLIKYVCFFQIIGPILVVLGHSLNGINVNDGLWYIISKQFIYIFHMPLFFYISGILLSTNNKWMNGKKYSSFILSKMLRLVVPYFVWNLIFLVPKILFQDYISDSVEISLVYLIKIFFFPRQNILGHTWFLLALFVVYLFTPIWKYVFNNKLLSYIFLLLAVAFYIIPIRTEFLGLSDIHRDLLFFFIGIKIGQLGDNEFKNIVSNKLILYLICTIISVSLVIIFYEFLSFAFFVPCLFILLFMTAVFCKFTKVPAWLFFISSNSFGIYILHWPIMLVTRIIFLQVLKVNVACVVILMIILGYFVPLFIVYTLKFIKSNKIKKILHYLIGV